MSLRSFVLATLIVAAPRTFAYAALGGNVHHVTSPVVGLAGAVILGMGVLGLVLAAREGAREGIGLPRWVGGRGRRPRPGPGPGGSGCVDPG